MWLPDILKPRVRSSPVAQYHRAYFYPVGAGNAAYSPAPPVVAAMLPVVNFSGNGALYAHSPNPLFGPQLYSQQTAYVSGVGGVLAGYMAHQPLNVPETTNGSQ